MSAEEIKTEQMPVVSEGDKMSVFTPALEKAKAIELVNQVIDFCKNQMVTDVDYGKIPGVAKPSLFKPGAEKLRLWFGLMPEFEVNVNKIELADDKFILSVDSICLLKNSVGMTAGWCQANCNSHEDKYKDQVRWYTDTKLPDGLDKRDLESKEFDGNWGKYTKYKVQSETDPYNILNTLVKMSQKRAFVGAVLMATGTSQRFTQDVEDFANDDKPPTKTKPKSTEKKSPPKPKQATGSSSGNMATENQLRALSNISAKCVEVGAQTQVEHEAYIANFDKLTIGDASKEIEIMQAMIKEAEKGNQG